LELPTRRDLRFSGSRRARSDNPAPVLDCQNHRLLVTAGDHAVDFVVG
jgi:hypothetical protein